MNPWLHDILTNPEYDAEWFIFRLVGILLAFLALTLHMQKTIQEKSRIYVQYLNESWPRLYPAPIQLKSPTGMELYSFTEEKSGMKGGTFTRSKEDYKGFPLFLQIVATDPPDASITRKG